MGLLDTIRSALGLQRPLVPLDPDTPLEISEEAREYLESLPEGRGIHIETRPMAGGLGTHVHEGDSQGPPPPGVAPLPITVSDTDLHQLRGLRLHRREGRWAMTLDLDLRGRATPNPNGRIYLVNRWLALGRPMFFTGDGPHPALAEGLLSIDGVRSVLLRDNTLTVEREANVTWDVLDAAVAGGLRSYFLLCGHALNAADSAPVDDPLAEEVWSVLEAQILPAIHNDGGDLQLVGINDGIVTVAMHGACRSCPASTATLRHGVERVLVEAFPGRIHGVEQV